MKIEVHRAVSEKGNLIFTIEARDPQGVTFSQEEFTILKHLDEAMVKINHDVEKKGIIFEETIMKIHDVKSEIHARMLRYLKNNIKLDFEPRFNHICQEIYNWLLENQDGLEKKWMLEFDPQRTRFYFDNDPKAKNQVEGDEDDVHEEEEEEEDDLDEEV